METVDLLSTIQEDFDVDARKAQELLGGLEDALGYHKDTGNIYYGEVTIEEYKTKIDSARKAIAKLDIALKGIGIHNRKTLDTIYAAANENDPIMIVFSTVEASGFELITSKMIKAIERAEKDIRNPGPGNAKREGKKYIAAIEMLARWFSDVFPDIELSSNPDDKFYKYVEIWFTYVLKEKRKKKLEDFRRHIDNTLSDPNARLYHYPPTGS